MRYARLGVVLLQRALAGNGVENTSIADFCCGVKVASALRCSRRARFTRNRTRERAFGTCSAQRDNAAPIAARIVLLTYQKESC